MFKKTNHIYALFFALALLSSCGTKNKVPANPNIDFTSPDLALHELKSNVEQVVITNFDATMEDGVIKAGECMSTDTIFFDDNGRITRMITAVPGKYISTDVFNYDAEGLSATGSRNVISDYWNYDLSLALERNEHGYITRVEGSSSTFEEQSFDDNYTWHGTQLKESTSIGWEWKTVRTYSYNDSGLRTAITAHTTEGPDSITVTTKYAYLDIDNNGNWLKRTSTDVTVEHAEDSDGAIQSTERSTTYTVQQRAITYRN